MDVGLSAGLTIGTARRRLAGQFRDAGIPTASLDARILFCHVLGVTAEQLVIDEDKILPSSAIATLLVFVSRRLAREPISHLTGIREFYGHDFMVCDAVLDPRPASEEGVTRLAEALCYRSMATPPTLFEPGIGSGCLLLSLLRALPQARGIGIDIDTEALAIASVNADRLGVADRVRLKAIDWCCFDAPAGGFDAIIANPPYLPHGWIEHLEPEVRLYEPRIALDGGADGLAAWRTLIPRLRAWLRPQGIIAMECAAAQVDYLAYLLSRHGLIIDHAASEAVPVYRHRSTLNAVWLTARR